MDQLQYTAFVSFLKEVPDPRDRRGCRYAWWFLLVVIASALLSGQQSARGMAQWAALHADEFRRHFHLDYQRMPSAATLRRTLCRLDVAELEAQMAAYARTVEPAAVQQEPAAQQERHVAIDGKVLRTASAYGQPIRLLSCVEHARGVTLAQCAVAPAAAENSMARQLLAQQDLRGWVVTGDALFTEHALAQQIVAQGGDYLLVVKANRPRLYQDIELLFEDRRWLTHSDEHADVAEGHGRRDTYHTICSSDLCDYLDWPGVQQVVMRERESQNGKTHAVTHHVTYAISSLKPQQAGADVLDQVWRNHWSIENRSHYVRDETFGEDRCRIRTGTAPQALAALRNGLIALIRSQEWQTTPDALRYYAASLHITLQTLGL